LIGKCINTTLGKQLKPTKTNKSTTVNPLHERGNGQGTTCLEGMNIKEVCHVDKVKYLRKNARKISNENI